MQLPVQKKNIHRSHQTKKLREHDKILTRPDPKSVHNNLFYCPKAGQNNPHAISPKHTDREHGKYQHIFSYPGENSN